MQAHICPADGRGQTQEAHCRSVSALCGKQAKVLRLQSLAQLIGLIHDFGKATTAFQRYLLWVTSHPGESLPGEVPHPNHAAAGAYFAYDRWYGGDQVQRMTAQIVALCVCGHHTGLHDCLNLKGESDFRRALEEGHRDVRAYEQAQTYFLSHVAPEEELDSLFRSACQEVGEHMPANAFQKGLLVRLLLSILVDADRWDSACFISGRDPMESERVPDWAELTARLDRYRSEHFPHRSGLNGVRAGISDLCAEKARSKPGIYQLSVPTGGGKTLASLRYGLLHGARNGQQRIFYVIPYNTILDQNARDIRAALDDYPFLLEHHSNVVKETEEEQTSYRQLTERWDSDIILTSLVQFLNALFQGSNSNARRMNRLVNAVIIFDEIQSLPKRCKVLFEQAVCFLTEYCHSTVLLCTATQPGLDFPGHGVTELMPHVEQLYRQLQRVHYIPQLEAELSYEQAAVQVCRLLQEQGSTLVIVNTKAAAWSVFDLSRQQLREAGFQPAEITRGLEEPEIRWRARMSAEDEVLCVHLSTLMCAAHRLELLDWVRIWTQERKQVLCVSTALIEAGINVSFPVVVRSLAGLPSIIQAGGRCNRNGEREAGSVYIWKLSGEKQSLTRLKEIQLGQNISGNLIVRCQKNPDQIASPAAIRRYFQEEQRSLQGDSPNPLRYPHPEKGWNTSLVELLSENEPCRQAACARDPELVKQLVLLQSFRSAGAVFQVIDQKTETVLVPYGAGRELIARLTGAHSMEEEIFLLRKAQAYSVSLFENVMRRLNAEHALVPVGETGATALLDGYYDSDGGVRTERQELEEMIF
ncbi:MAG: CRISPR-associated endonuclease Cas3'' [Candidatus Onthomonas sp.]